jgi:translation initiation factor IF-2
VPPLGSVKSKCVWVLSVLGAKLTIVDRGASGAMVNSAAGAVRLSGMLEPKTKDKIIGRAQVLAVFSASKFGKVAGCRVTDGELRRNAKVRLYRGADIVYEGDMGSLRHEKDDVKEVRQGYECGVGFKSFSDIQVGDQIVCYIVEKAE